MEQWLAAKVELEAATTNFLNYSSTLGSLASTSLSSSQNLFPLKETLAIFEQQLESIPKILEQLCTSHRVLNRLLNASTSRVPIHRLPTELINRIFEICTAIDPSEEATHKPLSRVSAVCCNWRRIALDNPSLWTLLDIEVDRGTVDVRGWLDNIATKLQRGQGAPIRLHLSQMSDDDSWSLLDNSTVSSLISLLRRHGPTFSSVSIQKLSQNDLLEAILSLCARDSTCTALRRLCVDACRPGDSTTWPTALGSSLVELEITDLISDCAPTMKDFLEMLASTTCLRFLRLESTTFRRERSSILPSVSLPELQLLILDLSIRDVSTLVLSLHPGDLPMDIRFHRATHFHIADTEPRESSAALWSTLSTLLSRCNVIALTVLVPYPVDSLRLASCLAATPRLRAFSFGVWGHPLFTPLDILLSSLRAHRTGELSDLRALCLHNALVDARSLDLLTELLEIVSLRRLCLIGCQISTDMPIMARIGTEYEALATQDELLRRVSFAEGFDKDPTEIYQGQDAFMQELIQET